MNKLTVVPVRTSGREFTYGKPVRLLQKAYALPEIRRGYDVSPDGRRFLMMTDAVPDPDATPARIVVVLNWFEELAAHFAKTPDQR
jgi:hypothetical protein